MIGTPLVFANVSLLFARALRFPIFARSSGLRVHEDARHNVHVVLPSGKDSLWIGRCRNLADSDLTGVPNGPN
jgi:hypothetical protein